MCFSIPFRIYFKDVSEIMKDCFGLNDEKKKYNRRPSSRISMDLIETQPVSSDDDDNASVFLNNLEDEIEKSYDFMDSD